MKFPRGLILAETLVAVAILAIAAVVLASIINNAGTATKVARDYLVAENLVTEGGEIVKGLKETNVLLRPQDVNPAAKACWLYLRPSELAANPLKACAGGTALEGGSYVYQYDGLGGLYLDAGGGGQEGFRLSLVDGVYVHNGAADDVRSKFYRRINFLEVEGDNNFAIFEVVVEWKDGGKDREVRREFKIFNLF